MRGNLHVNNYSNNNNNYGKNISINANTSKSCYTTPIKYNNNNHVYKH